MTFDTKLFYFINGLAEQVPVIDKLLVTFNTFGVIFFALVAVYFFFKNRQLFWQILLTEILSRGILTEGIRYLYHRPRPFLALSSVHLLIAKNLEGSFPSGHAAFYFAIAFSVYLFDKKNGAILIIAATFLSFARVYIGVHYPLDILSGILVAWLSVFIIRKLVN